MTQDYKTVIFEDNPYTSRKILGEATQPFMVRILLKTNLFKDERQIGFFLLGVVIVFLISSAIVGRFFAFPPLSDSTPIEDLTYIEQTQIDPIFLEGLRAQ